MEENSWNNFVIGRNHSEHHWMGDDDATNMGRGPEELIWFILLGLGVISMVMSIHFFRKFEHRGWLEDALFYWSFWSDSLEFLDDDDRQQQIDCSSCNQKLNIPFSYSGNISCPACGINMELEEGIIQAEGNPSDQG